MTISPYVFAQSQPIHEQETAKIEKPHDEDEPLDSQIGGQEAEGALENSEVEAIPPSLQKASKVEDSAKASANLRSSRMEGYNSIVIPYINANTVDYQSIISPLTQQFTGTIGIGTNVGDKSAFSHSNHNGFRRFFSSSDGYFDYWVTGRHFATVSNFRSTAPTPGFKGISGLGFGTNEIEIERLLSPTIRDSYELTYEPQLEVTKIEVYFRGTPNLATVVEGYHTFKGTDRKASGEIYMSPLAMKVNEIPSFDLRLGSDMSNVRSMISDRIAVSVGGTSISKEDVDVSVINNPTINTVGSRSIDYTLKWKKSSEVTTQGKADLKFTWGDTIAVGGLDNVPQRTTAAFSLHSGSSKKITVAQGNNDDNLAIHPYYSGEKYYSFDWFNMANLGSDHFFTAKKGDQHMEANGDELKQEAIKKWRAQTVNTGDIVRAWTAENKQYFIENEQLKTAEADSYYEITDQGFKRVNFNRLIPSKQTINYGTSKADLDKNIANYLDTSSFSNLAVKKFVTYPDTSKQGETKGTIQVEETTSSGKKLTYDYEVPFMIDRLTAKGKEGSSFLGQSLEQLDWKNFVQDVQLNGQSLSKEAYTTTLQDQLTLDTIGKKTITIRVALKNDPTNFVDVDSTLDVKWGNTIKIGGIELQDSPAEGRSVAAFTFQSGTKKQITVTQGNQNDNSQIHNSFPGKKYYSFDWFDLKNSTSMHFEPNKAGTQHLEATGDERKQTVLSRWKNPEVAVGDVVRSWMLEERQYLYENETPISHGRDNYYEITTDGFKLLHLNKLKVTKQTVNFGMSQSELDGQLKNYLDTSDYSKIIVKKFVTYPDTKKQGETKGTIQVEETTASGKKVTYDYEVPFQVEQLSAKEKPGTGRLGQTESEFDWADFVQSVQLNGQSLNSDAYKVTKRNSLVLDTIGKKTINLRVALVNDPTIYIDLDTNVEVKWGSTIATGGLDYSPLRTTAAFTLRQDGRKEIVISQGNSHDNQSIHHFFKDNKYYSFDWFNLKGISSFALTSEKKGDQHLEATGNELKQTAIKRWKTQPVTTGDVVRAWVAEDKHYFIENEQQNKTPSDSYYEVTDQGFKKLLLNRLTPVKQTINYALSNSEMDKQLSKYLDTSNYSKLKALKFVRYPDTSKQGETDGVIRIEETTDSGKKLTYDYTIPFTVERLTAKEKPGTINLGGSVNQQNWKEYVQRVELSGQTIPEDAYTVTLKNQPTFDTIGTKKVKLQVSLAKDPTIFCDIEVSIEVKWGSTIALGGLDYSVKRTTAAFTLHSGSKPFISAAQGNSSENYEIHFYFKDKKYYSFDWFNLKATNQFHLEPTKLGDQHIEATGNDKKQDVLKKWQKQSVTTGDVVRAWTAEDKHYFIENEQQNNSHADSYYEITDHGFKKLAINRLTPKKKPIDFKLSQEELDKNKGQYLDASQYSRLKVKEFVKYPDTSQQGESEGILRVEETTTSGKKLTFDYKIDFIVDSPKAPTAEARTQIITLNGSLPTDAMKTLTNIQYDGDMTELKATYTKKPDTSVVGSAKAEVTLVTPDGKKTVISIPVFVKDEQTVIKNEYAIQATGFTLYDGEVSKAEEANTLKELILKKSLAKAWNIHTGSVETSSLTIATTDIDDQPGVYKATVGIKDTTKELTINVVTDSEMIDMTVPVATKFAGLDVDNGKVKSPKYTITNNSPNDVDVAVNEIRVRSNPSQIRLLKSQESDPSGQENSAKLSLRHSLDATKTNLDLISSTPNQLVFSMESMEKGLFSIDGNYFGEFSNPKRLAFDIIYSFQVKF